MIRRCLIYIASIFLLSCSGQHVKETIDNYSKYTLLHDNLYSDKEGNLYLKSENKEDIDHGTTHDVWLKTVYCDTCWTATEEGFEDITELKDVVDVNTFHLTRRDDKAYGVLYEDKNYRYFHKFMADGGTITLMRK